MPDARTRSLGRRHAARRKDDRPPVEAWQTEDGNACAILTRHASDGDIGLIVMRRREDRVWAVTVDDKGLPDVETARERAAESMKDGAPPEPMPPGTPRRPPLHDLQGRAPSEIFKLLTARTHQNVAWLLNQLYLSLPRPDRNWAAMHPERSFGEREAVMIFENMCAFMQMLAQRIAMPSSPPSP